MAKKASKAKKSGQAPTRKIGHLLVRFQGKYYFVPADKVGDPLDESDPEMLAKLVEQVQGLEAERGVLVGLEFAMEIAETDAATGMVIKRRN